MSDDNRRSLYVAGVWRLAVGLITGIAVWIIEDWRSLPCRILLCFIRLRAVGPNGAIFFFFFFGPLLFLSPRRQTWQSLNVLGLPLFAVSLAETIDKAELYWVLACLCLDMVKLYLSRTLSLSWSRPPKALPLSWFLEERPELSFFSPETPCLRQLLHVDHNRWTNPPEADKPRFSLLGTGVSQKGFLRGEGSEHTLLEDLNQASGVRLGEGHFPLPFGAATWETKSYFPQKPKKGQKGAVQTGLLLKQQTLRIVRVIIY